jgi:pumilio family protein 6
MTAKESGKRKGHDGGGKDSNKRLKSKEEGTDEKSSSAQKRQVRKDRQSQRRHADTVADAKVLWNKLRQKSNTTEETKDLMEQVMKLIRGKVNEVALQHDASRVVQAAIQFGSDEQRKELLTEICGSSGSLAELSKIQYAHFCCLKFIKYCNRDSDSVQMIIKVGYELGVS